METLDFIKTELASKFAKKIKAIGNGKSTSVQFGDLTYSSLSGNTLENL